MAFCAMPSEKKATCTNRIRVVREGILFHPFLFRGSGKFGVVRTRLRRVDDGFFMLAQARRGNKQ
jgi:hypothetical protein